MFVRDLARAGALVGAVALALAAWQLAYILLLGFLGLLVAILLRQPAEALARRTPLPVGAALAVVILGVAALAAAFVVSIGPRILAQLGQLWTQLPAAAAEVTAALEQRQWGQALLARLEPPDDGPRWSALGAIGGTVSTLIGLAANLVVVLTVAVFLAADPGLYRRGAVRLVPPARRARAGEVLDALGEGLWRWLLGQLFDMLVVAGLVWLGLWLLGVPLPLALGVVAGLLNFVPYVGPFLGAAPAVLIALGQGPEAAVWTALLFLAVQQFEGNVVMPLVQRRATAMPPALTILAVAGFGVLFGLLGVFLAAPLLLVLLVLARMLWVEDALGDRLDPSGSAEGGGAAARDPEG